MAPVAGPSTMDPPSVRWSSAALVAFDRGPGALGEPAAVKPAPARYSIRRPSLPLVPCPPLGEDAVVVLLARTGAWSMWTVRTRTKIASSATIQAPAGCTSTALELGSSNHSRRERNTA